MLSFNNALWIIGGYDNDNGISSSEVWTSTDGTSWTLVTNSAAFGPRHNHASVVFDNKMWVIDGMIYDEYGNQSQYSNIYYSVDGSNWVLATANPPFEIRHSHTAVVANGKIWVIGGYSFNLGALNDVWCSSDGINWECVNDGSNNSFTPTWMHTSVFFDNKLWVIGGQNSLGEVWYAQ